jgi:UPF0755 protein
MNTITSFIRFVFNASLLLAGAVVLIIAVGLYAGDGNPGDPRLLIETGPLERRPVISSEARTLFPTLQARVEEINTPVSDDSRLVAFSVEAGETAQTVAERLRAQGLVNESQLFRQLLRYNGIDTRLMPGSYLLRRNMTMKEIGAALFRGRSAQMTVTIPAGWRMEQLAEYLTNADIMDGTTFLKLARRGNSIGHYILADRPAGHSYEGYLFPDTYLVSDQARPEDLIFGMMDNLANKLPPGASDLARRQGLTLHEVLTLASIIERETAVPAERPIIASVYLNRLNSATPLQADPTVQYAMGYQSATGQWWKTPVRLEEYKFIDSPYNTYLYADLPPGPISSPSLASIMAVLQPAETNFLFFVCQRPRCEGGRHVFAETYDEHLQNVAVYWEQSQP